MKDRILEVLEQIEKAEGVWDFNQAAEASKKNSINTEPLKTKYASVPRNTGKYLAKLVEQKQPSHILEIGSSVGYSTLWLATAAMPLGIQITATELNPERYTLLLEHIRMAGLEQTITAKNIDAREEIELLESLDFVFLDAFKNEYSEFVNLVLPKLKAKGLLVIDNIVSHRPKTDLLLDLLKKRADIKCDSVNIDNGLLIIQKLP